MPQSTLTTDERKTIWEDIAKMGYSIQSLKGIVQNPMLFTHADLAGWSKEVEGLRVKLLELQQNVIMLASGRIV